jgi:SAM-dependent methyltransferase
MSRYDSFAAHYDHVVGSRIEVAHYLRALIRKYHKKAQSLLELGCGSGSMLKVLSLHYSCEGLDLSHAMLKIARKKAPRARLHQGDITNFNLGRRFDVVVCPFDTMNHVTSFAQWKHVFQRAHEHLNVGGVFIFDVNTEYKLESYRHEPFVTENSDNFVSIIEVRKVRRHRYEIVLKRFHREAPKRFGLNQMVLPEIVVPTDRISQALGMHFSQVTMVDPDRRRPCDETDDLFFVCRGPRR